MLLLECFITVEATIYQELRGWSVKYGEKPKRWRINRHAFGSSWKFSHSIVSLKTNNDITLKRVINYSINLAGLIRKAKVEIKDKIFLKVKSARIKWVHLTIFEDNHDDFLEILRDEFKSIHRGHLHWEIISKIIKYDRDNKVRAWNHYGMIGKKKHY